MRALAKQTTGDKLCWGDIEAALTKAAEETVAHNVKNAVEQRMQMELWRTVSYSTYRRALEEELKKKYPSILTDELMSLQMKTMKITTATSNVLKLSIMMLQENRSRQEQE